MNSPRQLDSPLYQLLHAEDIEGFNRQKPADGWIDLAGGDSAASTCVCWMPPASTSAMPISAAPTCAAWICARRAWRAPAWPMRRYPVRIPLRLAPDEIRMSVNFGTRLRYLPEP